MSHSLTAYPFIGKVVNVDEDLDPAPSVLIRFKGIPDEFGNYKLIVKATDTDSTVVMIKSLGVSSVLLGVPRDIPDAWKDDWKELLEEIAPGNQGSQYRAMLLNAWKRPIYYPAIYFTPGHHYEIKLLDSKGGLWGSEECTILSAALQDILIKPTP